MTLDERTDSTAVDAMEHATKPLSDPEFDPLFETEQVVTPTPVRAFCWACGDTHSDSDICIPRTE